MKIIHNKVYNETIFLNDDQEICPRCKGDGFLMKYDITEEDILLHYIKLNMKTEITGECWACNAEGYIDWVERVFLSDWEATDIKEEEKYQAEIQAENEEDNYWEELKDHCNSSFS